MPSINTAKKVFLKPKRGKRLKELYEVSCANIDCNNTIIVKKSVWEDNKKFQEHKRRIFTCSKACCFSDSVMKLKKQKMLKKYGVENVFQLEEVKAKIKKINLKKYGSENPFASEEIKSKIRKINLQRLGVEHPQQNKNIQEKTKETRRNRYKNDLQGWAIRSALEKTNLERYGVKQFWSYFNTKDYYLKKYGSKLGMKLWKKRCKSYAVTLEKMIQKYGFKRGHAKYLKWKDAVNPNLENFIKRYGEEEGFTKFQIFNEKRIKNLLKNGKNSNLNDKFELILNNLRIEYEREFLLNSKWYDFYVSKNDKKILLEVNGGFWHCDPRKYEAQQIIKFPGRNGKILVEDVWKKDYEKYKKAAAQGYSVFYFWEYDIENNLDFVKRKIREIMNA